MALTAKQRAWLRLQKLSLTVQDLELLRRLLDGKDEKKTKNIQVCFTNYARRRDKVIASLNEVSKLNSSHYEINQKLVAAEKMANAGMLVDAYNCLKDAKNWARETVKGTHGEINQRESLEVASSLVTNAKNQVRIITEFYNSVDAALGAFTCLVPCSEQPDFEAAVKHHKALVTRGRELRRDLKALREKLRELETKLANLNIEGIIRDLEAAVQFLEITKRGGRSKTVGSLNSEIKVARGIVNASAPKFLSALPAGGYLAEAERKSEKILLARKSLDTFRDAHLVGEQGAAAAVPKSDGPKFEDKSLNEAKKRYEADIKQDTAARVKTGTGAIDLVPIPDIHPKFTEFFTTEKFKPRDSMSDKDQVAFLNKFRGEISGFLKCAEMKKSDFLDLICLDEVEVKEQLSDAFLFSGILTEYVRNQQALIGDMAKVWSEKVKQHLPNRVAKDSKTVTLDGTVYSRVKVLQEGAMGVATLFKDPTSGKMIVMKTPKAKSKETLDDFLTEMRNLNYLQKGAVDSPLKLAIPELYGAACDADGSLHMLMEFIDGGDMHQVSYTMNALASSGFLPPAARIAVQADMVRKAASALSELHRLGLMHRDLKGKNIMMTKTGDIKIIDYGSSLFVDTDGKKDTKRVGKQGTTPGHSPPEMGKGKATVTVDNYALGSMLLDMVGQKPLDSGSRSVQKSTAFDRLIAALHDVAENRLSLEGLAESAFMKSFETDFSSDTMSRLFTAAVEFAQDTKSLKYETSDEEQKKILVQMLKSLNKVNVSQDPEKRVWGIDEAQDLIRRIDDKSESLWRLQQNKPEEGRSKEEFKKLPAHERAKEANLKQERWMLNYKKSIEVLIQARNYIQIYVIDDMLDTALKAANTAYERALKDPGKTFDVEFVGEKKTLTLAQAVEEHAELVDRIEENRRSTIKMLKMPGGTDDRTKETLDANNSELVKLADAAKRLRTFIEKAAGPDAKIRFSKARLDAATAPFGPSVKRRTQKEVDEDTWAMIDAQVAKVELHAELELRAEAKPAE